MQVRLLRRIVRHIEAFNLLRRRQIALSIARHEVDGDISVTILYIADDLFNRPNDVGAGRMERPINTTVIDDDIVIMKINNGS